MAASNTYSVIQGTTLTVVVPGVLGNDTDVDGNTLTAVNISNPAHGTLTTFSADGSFTYSPNLNYTGTDSFTYQAYDGQVYSSAATVTINVTQSVSTFGLGNGNGTSNESRNYLNAMRFQNNAGTGTLTKLEILFNDSTPNGKARLGVYADNNGVPGSRLIDAGEVTVSNGWVSISSLNLPVTQNNYYWLAFNMQSTNGVTYQSGQPSRSHYRVSSTYGTLPSTFPSRPSYNSNQYVMRATVTTGGNTPPLAVGETFSTDEDTTLTVSAPGVLGNDTDTDGNPLTAVKVTNPAHGTLTLNANGSFTYTPTAQLQRERLFHL